MPIIDISIKGCFYLCLFVQSYESLSEVLVLITGDHMRIVRSIYDHHMVVIEVIDETHVKVVHFNNKRIYDFFLRFPNAVITFNNFAAIIGALFKFGILFPAEIREQEIAIDADGEEVQVLEYGKGEVVFSREEIVRRARSEVGSRDYNLFWNNCESIINWLIIGRPVSKQGEKAALVGLVLLMAVGAIFLAILATFVF